MYNTGARAVEVAQVTSYLPGSEKPVYQESDCAGCQIGCQAIQSGAAFTETSFPFYITPGSDKW